MTTLWEIMKLVFLACMLVGAVNLYLPEDKQILVSTSATTEEVAPMATEPEEITMGNHSWIRFDEFGFGFNESVLYRLVRFEKDHPELELISWQFQPQVRIYEKPYKYSQGIWLHHRPRPPK